MLVHYFANAESLSDFIAGGNARKSSMEAKDAMGYRRLSDTRLVAFLSLQGIEPVRAQVVKRGTDAKVVYEFAMTDEFTHWHGAFFNDIVSISPSALLKKYADVMFRAKQLMLEAGLNRPIVAGVVERFDSDKGWGFLRSKECLEDIFIHIGNVVAGGIPQAGNVATFEISQTERGPKAINVRIVERSKA